MVRSWKRSFASPTVWPNPLGRDTFKDTKLLSAVLLLVAALEPAVAKTALPAPEWPRRPGSGRVELAVTLPCPGMAVTPNQKSIKKGGLG